MLTSDLQKLHKVLKAIMNSIFIKMENNKIYKDTVITNYK